jgi:hypothetical protein
MADRRSYRANVMAVSKNTRITRMDMPEHGVGVNAARGMKEPQHGAPPAGACGSEPDEEGEVVRMED